MISQNKKNVGALLFRIRITINLQKSTEHDHHTKNIQNGLLKHPAAALSYFNLSPSSTLSRTTTVSSGSQIFGSQ